MNANAPFWHRLRFRPAAAGTDTSGFRALLSGSGAAFQASPAALLVAAGGGLVWLAIWAICDRYGGKFSPVAPWTWALAAGTTAVLTTWLAARWLGRYCGTAAAVLYWISACHFTVRSDAAQAAMSASVVAALSMFAAANLPARGTAHLATLAQAGFFALLAVTGGVLGPGGPLAVVLVCGLYAVFNGDARSIRFLCHWPGWLLLGTALLGRVVVLGRGIELGAPAWHALPGLFSHLALACLPWTTLAVVAAVIGLREGLWATAPWRLLACWLVGCTLLAVAGLLPGSAMFTAVFPAVAMIGAAGVQSAATALRKYVGRRTVRQRPDVALVRVRLGEPQAAVARNAVYRLGGKSD